MAALGGLGNFTSMANMSSMPPNMSMSNSNMMGTNNKPGLGMCFYELNPFFSTHLELILTYSARRGCDFVLRNVVLG